MGTGGGGFTQKHPLELGLPEQLSLEVIYHHVGLGHRKFQEEICLGGAGRLDPGSWSFR